MRNSVLAIILCLFVFSVLGCASKQVATTPTTQLKYNKNVDTRGVSNNEMFPTIRRQIPNAPKRSGY